MTASLGARGVIVTNVPFYKQLGNLTQGPMSPCGRTPWFASDHHTYQPSSVDAYDASINFEWLPT